MSQPFGTSSTAPLFIFGSGAQNKVPTNTFTTTSGSKPPYFFTGIPSATTSNTTTKPNPTQTFAFNTKTQSPNVLTTSSTLQPFDFGTGPQNTPTTGAFGNPVGSKLFANFTTSNFNGGFNAGTQSTVPPTQPINGFSFNAPRIQANFTPMSIDPNASTTATMPTVPNSMTTTATVNQTPWTNAPSKPDGSINLFKQALQGVKGTQNNLFTTTMNTTVPASTNSTTSAAAFPNSIFGPAAAKPLGPPANATQGTFNFSMDTKPFVPFNAGSQTNSAGNVFSQPTVPMFNGNTDPTKPTHLFTIPIPTTVNSTTSILPMTNNFTTNGATTTVSNFNTNPQLTTSLSEMQTKPIVTSTSMTTIAQVPQQVQNTEHSVPLITQQFLAALLLDPYANHGKKDFSSIGSIQVPVEPAVTSTVSTSTSLIITTAVTNTTTTTVTNSTPLQMAPIVQTNIRKAPSHSLIDVNFKLKPTSSATSLSALNDIIQPNIQQSELATKSLKSTFTDEEESLLLSQHKTSRSRLSTALNDSLYQSNSIQSLYPLRRLAELENLVTKTSSSSLSSSDESHNVSLNHSSKSSIIPQQSSSPMIQPKKNTDSQNRALPILTRPYYYTKPNNEELKSLFNHKGQCILSQFTVGHEKYGSITFYGRVDVAGLNLDEIIEIKHHEVTVYPDDNNKPAIGEQLNLPARITLFGVYPIDRATHEEITDTERIEAMNYDQYLLEITQKFDGEFINYGFKDGSWTFMVKHFTSYGLNDNQNEFIVPSEIMNCNKAHSLYDELTKLNS